jgi:acid phosphatase type 7
MMKMNQEVLFKIKKKGECGIPFVKKFSMPIEDVNENKNIWYSFNYGPIHFIIISLEHNFLKGF